MDVRFFLNLRTSFIRRHYEGCVRAFERVKLDIEEENPPYVPPTTWEDPEPAFLEEWMDAHASIQLAGLDSIGLLAQTIRQYLLEIQKYQLCFEWEKKELKRVQQDFVNAYKEAIGEILDTDWSDAGVDFAILEQCILARNRGQHGTTLTMLEPTHDAKSLEKHPLPFFAEDHAVEAWQAKADPTDSFFRPNVSVTREKLFAAIDEIEKLANWVEANLDRAAEWREKQREKRDAGSSPA